MTRKLCRIILLHLGPITFRFQRGKPHTVVMLIFFGPTHQINSNNSKELHLLFETMLQIENVELWEKTSARRRILKIRTCFEHLAYGIDIFQQNMKWELGTKGA